MARQSEGDRRPKLPPLAFAKETWRLAWVLRRRLLGIALPWLVWLILISLLFEALGSGSIRPGRVNAPLSALAIAWLVYLPGEAVIIVLVTRLVATAQEPPPAPAWPFRALLACFGLLLAFELTTFVVIRSHLWGIGLLRRQFPQLDLLLLVSLLFALLFSAVLARISLILPAQALDQWSITLRDVWRATRGNTLAIALGALFAILPALAIALVVVFLGEVVRPLGIVLFQLAEIVTRLLFAVYFALAYRYFFNAVSRSARSA